VTHKWQHLFTVCNVASREKWRLRRIRRLLLLHLVVINNV